MTSLGDFVSENFRELVVLGGGYALAVQQGYLPAPYVPELPEFSGIFILALLGIGAAGYVAGGKILELIPEEEGVYLACMESEDYSGVQIWNLSRDRFADMDVREGNLMKWKDSPKEVYEAYHYNDDTNTAVAGWREVPSGSEVGAGIEVEEVYHSIEELKEEFAPAEHKLNLIRRSLRSVARRLDRRRLEEQNQILDPRLTPEFGEGDERPAGVSGILREELPPELLPEGLQEESDDDQEESDDGEEFVSMDILDETEPMKND